MDDTIAEASLAELVSDPLIGLLMKSDGVDRRSIELLFEHLAQLRTTPFATAPRADCHVPGGHEA